MADFRITFKTSDGILVMNRLAVRSLYFLPNGKPDHEFIEHILKIDCRERGVRLINYNVNENSIDALVDYY